MCNSVRKGVAASKKRRAADATYATAKARGSRHGKAVRSATVAPLKGAQQAYAAISGYMSGLLKPVAPPNAAKKPSTRKKPTRKKPTTKKKR